MSPYGRAAREAIPVKAGCEDCDWEAAGPGSRDSAAAHRRERPGHATWVECVPPPEVLAS